MRGAAFQALLASALFAAVPTVGARALHAPLFNRPVSLGSPQRLAFPSLSATSIIGGSASPLEESQWFWRQGDVLEEMFARVGPVSSLTLDLTVRDDTTDYCAPDTPQRFEVSIGDRVVGQFTLISGVKGKTGELQVPVKYGYRFPATMPRGGKIKLRIEMKTTVCSGGGSFAWVPSGTVWLR